ncbi:MAG: hypothetical protein M3547_15760, partial [Acidobacteriota bacterium]|nr:hypothetical protein [Acidobacteriota bacterium]
GFVPFAMTITWKPAACQVTSTRFGVTVGPWGTRSSQTVPTVDSPWTILLGSVIVLGTAGPAGPAGAVVGRAALRGQAARHTSVTA